jgi:hypothetical protein
MTNKYYETAVSKGWHENDERSPTKPWKAFVVRWLDMLRRWLTKDGPPTARQQLAWLSLIMTEWLEALDDAMDGIVWSVTENGKPEGLLSELADIYIRCQDTIGAMGGDAEKAKRNRAFIPRQAVDKIAYAVGAAAECCRAAQRDTYLEYLGAIMFECEVRATNVLNEERRKDIANLPTCWAEVVYLKAEYNKTRPWMHGGKLV